MDQGTGLSVIESVLNSAQMSNRLTILTSYLGQVVCGQLGVGDTGLSGQGEIVGCGRYWPVWAGRDSWVWEILAWETLGDILSLLGKRGMTSHE